MTVLTRRDRWWQVGVWIVLAFGVSTSLFLSWSWHAKLRADDRAAFRTQAWSLARVVGSGLSRDTDFAATVRSLVATTPQLTNPEFAHYIASAGAAQRYPGGLGYAYFEKVPAAGLAAFQARLAADPPAEESLAGYRVSPPGARASYCLTRFSAGPGLVAPVAGFPVGLDVCAPGGVLGVSTSVLGGASGTFSVVVLLPGVLGIAAPVYAGGVVPTTVAGRQAAFTGWIGVTTATSALLPDAAADNRMQVHILFQGAGSVPTVVASSGAAPRGRLLTVSLPVNADGQWTVEVRGVTPGAAAAWVEPAVALLVGLLLTGTIFGFVQVLARSRRRALRLVAERTAELHYQALHDSLTGLANRELILDRIELMLARGRREHSQTAVLFMDLDGFKDVNDTYGHAAGDRLLEAVAGRITATLRQSDSAGRLGGDEFIVLVESADASADMVADRLLVALREPFVLAGADGVSVPIKASIGIAVGDRPAAGQLLGDADMALYQAKAAGGDQYAFFDPAMRSPTPGPPRAPAAPALSDSVPAT